MWAKITVPLGLVLSSITGLAQTFTGPGGSIPDDGNWYEAEIAVSGLPNTVDTVNFGLEQVCINVEHSWIADLDITIVAPDGSAALLVGGNGGDQDFYTNTCFRADATALIVNGVQPYTGDWLPMQQMGVANNGQNPNGIWKLHIQDTYPFADAGALLDWSISFGNDPATYFSITDSNLPIVVINSQGSIPNEPKVPATMGIINNPPGVRNAITDPFTDYDGRIGIELRGNSSLSFPKKSYSLELWDDNDNDTSFALLGMPAESDWILSANYSDKSLLNNPLTFHVGRKMGHWAPRTQHVELVLDGQYIGTYVFTEKIKRDGDRVDIAKLLPTDIAGDDVTGGYILKIDWAQGNNAGGWTSPFPPPNAPGAETIDFIYDYPQVPVPEQETYIQAYVDSFETALSGPDFTDPVLGYAQYIDQRSFIDFLIVNELARNVDGYRLSTFLHKDKDSNGGKLAMGPLWDFDLAWHNADYCNGSSYTGWAYDLNYDCPGGKMVPFWWWRLLEDQAFSDSLRCRWDELREGPLHTDSLVAWCDSMATYLDESQERNFRVWPILGTYVWPNPWPVPTEYAGEITELRDWLALRSAWLDLHWPENVGGCLHVDVPDVEAAGTMQLYPNPFSDQLTVTGPFVAGEEVVLDLTDAMGRHLHRWSARTHAGGTIVLEPPSGLPPGNYALRVRTNSKTRTFAVVKQ